MQNINWRKKLAELDVPEGFTPTNKGMLAPEDLVDELTYRSYAYNRSLGISADGWKKMMNYELDDVDQIQLNNARVDAMERRYLIETQHERN